MSEETLSNLYWLAIITALILGPTAWWLYRRTMSQMSPAAGPAEHPPYEQEPVVQHFRSTPAASSPSGPVKLAPIELVVKQLLQATPHIGIIGDTGAGKTTTGEAIIRLLTGEAFVADPKWWRGKWGGLPAAGLDDNAGYGQIDAGLRAVFAEFNRRRIHKRDNPDAVFPDLWLIWDEINDTMEELPDAGVPLRRLLRVGREYNVHVLFFPQSDRVGALGLEGHGDAVKNVLWMYLGNDARDIVKRLIKNGKISAAYGQQIIELERPAVVGHAGEFYAVGLSAAPALAKQPLTGLRGWKLPTPNSDVEKTDDSTLGVPELATENPSKKWPELREAAIRYWILQGLNDSEISLKVDKRREDARLMAKEIRAQMKKEAEEKALQEQLISEPAAA